MTSIRKTPLTTLERQAARHLHTVRGARHERGIAAEAWHCAGTWQAKHQMDIWQCLDEVELDALRAAGELDDTDTDDNQEV